MTLDEAIEHAEERARGGSDQCAEDHAQLSDWLRELRRARMEIDLLKTLRNGFRADAQKYKAENAKLRELVSVVYGYYASGTISPCDLCDAIGCQYVGEAESGCRYRDHFDSAEAADDEIKRRMRELGIEVDG